MGAYPIQQLQKSAEFGEKVESGGVRPSRSTSRFRRSLNVIRGTHVLRKQRGTFDVIQTGLYSNISKHKEDIFPTKGADTFSKNGRFRSSNLILFYLQQFTYAGLGNAVDRVGLP